MVATAAYSMSVCNAKDAHPLYNWLVGTTHYMMKYHMDKSFASLLLENELIVGLVSVSCQFFV